MNPWTMDGFKHLRVFKTTKNNAHDVIQLRINSANKAYYVMNKKKTGKTWKLFMYYRTFSKLIPNDFVCHKSCTLLQKKMLKTFQMNSSCLWMLAFSKNGIFETNNCKNRNKQHSCTKTMYMKYLKFEFHENLSTRFSFLRRSVFEKTRGNVTFNTFSNPAMVLLF